MGRKLVFVFALSSMIFSSAAFAGRPGVWFENLKDGQTVASPLLVKMGVSGKSVAPAGSLDTESGHHHIIIDSTFIAAGDAIPADDKHLHFGKGQTEAEVSLPPGKHTLTLQFADGFHRSFGKEWSATITLIVPPT